VAIEHIKDVLVRAMTKIEARHANPSDISGIPSGIPSLDWLTDGFQKELYILGARTSVGKSALLKDFILAGAKAGNHMHLINLEDSNSNTVIRQLSARSGIDLWKIHKGKQTDEEMMLLYKKASELSTLKITFEDSAYDAKSIETALCNAVQKCANAVLIDYLQLIKGQGHKQRLEQLEEASWLLKKYSKKIPIIAAVQINRGVEDRKDKRPTMSDIRSCGTIEQDADVIMLLYRDSYYTKDLQDKTAELNVVKGRNCPTGMINLIFDSLKATFREATVQ